MTTTIAADFLAALQARFPNLDWAGIQALPGTRTLHEIADWALAAGVDAETVEWLMYLDPPGWTH